MKLTKFWVTRKKSNNMTLIEKVDLADLIDEVDFDDLILVDDELM
jgi:hypothetical protein